ncbi:unnamed protein product [Brachionus calyciflorus]|uniref:Uncharacterized protein n=1 Tax=Brachionus calyciflorus TaxID=104777 RepID=A0A814RL99_9BILA|nr:unnamed protein product [Brachionus calyciflorus]
MLKCHPLIYELIDWFRSEENLTNDKIIQAKTGFKYTRKPHYVKLDERIKEILNDYDKNNFDEFYDNFALIKDY